MVAVYVRGVHLGWFDLCNLIMYTCAYTFIRQSYLKEDDEFWWKMVDLDFKIIIVDNSGYTFPELEKNNKLHILSYYHNNIDIPEENKFILSSTEKGSSNE